MPKETREELAALAGKVLNMDQKYSLQTNSYYYNALLADAKRLAGSVLSQYETDAPATEEKADIPTKSTFKERAMAAIDVVPVKDGAGNLFYTLHIVENKLKALVEVLAETLDGANGDG